jgi:hypothetical protein
MPIPSHPLPTPTLGPPSALSFTVLSQTHINASPGTCLQIILDVDKYPLWNRFVPSVTIDSHPSSTAAADTSQYGHGTIQKGSRFTFHVNMDAGQPGMTVEKSARGSLRATPEEATILGEVTPGADDAVDAIFDEVMSASKSMGPESRSPPSTQPRFRVCWSHRSTYTMPSFLLRSERIQEFRLVESEDRTKGLAGCDYVTWETFFGVLAPVVRMAVGEKLKRCFEVWGEDLKGRAERVEAGLA